MPPTAQSDPTAPSIPFRTAKQLKEDMIREGKGGFVPLPSLVQTPSVLTQPSFVYSIQDATVSQVGGNPVQFAIHHQGSKGSVSGEEGGKGR